MGGGYDKREQEFREQRKKDDHEYRLGNMGISTGSLMNQYGKQEYDKRNAKGAESGSRKSASQSGCLLIIGALLTGFTVICIAVLVR